MKKMLGITLLVLLALIAGSGCTPFPSYGYGFQQPVHRQITHVPHRCPGYRHYLQLADGRWLIHTPSLTRGSANLTSRRRLSSPVPQGTRGAERTLEPDWGAAATQPATADDRIERLERRVEAIGKGTKAILKVVRKFQFDDSPSAKATGDEAASPQPPDDE